MFCNGLVEADSMTRNVNHSLARQEFMSTVAQTKFGAVIRIGIVAAGA